MKKILIPLLIGMGCKSEEMTLLPPEWKVGQWVSYLINGVPVKISVVGREYSYFWLEVVEPGIVVKALVERGDIANPKKIIVKEVNKRESYEFDGSRVLVSNTFPIVRGKGKGKVEVLNFPCGKVKAIFLKKNGKEVWFSNKIPIFGIAKCKNGKIKIELINYGLSGGKSEIKGEIKKVEI